MKKSNNWVEFAKEDLIVAQASLEKSIYNLVCFHAQQGVEKMLKGYLAAKDQDIPKIHSVDKLLTLCVQLDPDFRKMVQVCSKVDDYYVPTRYPDALPGALPGGLPDENDAREAVAVLEEAMEFVAKKLNES